MNSIELDVSAEEAPIPLVRATEALQKLSNDSYLHVTHRMAPCRLYDYLEQHGFYTETRRGNSGLCEIFICHADAAEVKLYIAQLVKDMTPWH